MCLAQRPCYHLDSGRDCSLAVGPMGLYSSQVRITASPTQPWQRCASQLHLLNRRLRTNLHRTVTRCASDFLAALLCSTHSELVASWPQILNYGLVTNGCAPPCSWATDFYAFSVNFILSVELYTYSKIKHLCVGKIMTVLFLSSQVCQVLC